MPETCVIHCNRRIGSVLVMLGMVLAIFMSTPQLRAADPRLPKYDDPMICNHTSDYETILYANEQIKLVFRNLGQGKISFKQYKIQSMRLTYEVRDLDNKLVTQGSQTAERTYGKRQTFMPSVMINLNLPREQSVGWFRVFVSLVGDDMQGKAHVFGTTWVDLAVLPPRKHHVQDRFFGISGPLGATQPTPALTQYNLPILERMGVASLRTFTSWSSMQQSPDEPLNYRRLDRVVDVCKSGDIDVLLTLVGTPDFAAQPIDPNLRIPINQPIPKIEPWEKYLTQMAAHYRGKVKAWAILNETNGFRQWPDADPKTYADFYMRSYQVIRQQDPNVLVSIGGTTGVKYEWIKNVSDDGAGPMMEIVALHPYRYAQVIPERGNEKYAKGYGQASLIEDLQNTVKVVSQMPSTLSGKPREIWSTESGFNTRPCFPPPLHKAVTEKQQAQLLVRTMAIARTQQIKRFFWWRFYDTLGAGLGILRNEDYNFMPKPAVVSYAVLQRHLAGAKDVTLITHKTHPEIYACKATFADQPDVYVIWSIDKPKSHAVQCSAPVTVTDMMGVARQQQPQQGSVTLSLSQSPIYLESSKPLVLFKP